MFALSVVVLYTEDDSCIAIETFVSKMNRPVKLSSHHESIPGHTLVIKYYDYKIAWKEKVTDKQTKLINMVPGYKQAKTNLFTYKTIVNKR